MLSPDAHVADLLTFPALDREGRIVSTRNPGWFAWNTETATLTATNGAHILPRTVFRHHYRLNHDGVVGQSPMVLVRIEKQLEDPAPTSDWQKVWEAPEWGVPATTGPNNKPRQ
jgi:hypothetical protein